MIDRELKKREAIERMKKVGIFDGTIKDFKDDDLVSQSLPSLGACYWIEGEQLDRVRRFEEQHNALVYFVIHSYTEIGEMDSYLFVSDHEEEWEQDREDMEYGQLLAYVYNYDDPDLSEFGHIGFELTVAGGLRRVW